MPSSTLAPVGGEIIIPCMVEAAPVPQVSFVVNLFCRLSYRVVSVVLIFFLITKTRLFKYIENFTIKKNECFQIKNLLFFIMARRF